MMSTVRVSIDDMAFRQFPHEMGLISADRLAE